MVHGQHDRNDGLVGSVDDGQPGHGGLPDPSRSVTFLIVPRRTSAAAVADSCGWLSWLRVASEAQELGPGIRKGGDPRHVAGWNAPDGSFCAASKPLVPGSLTYRRGPDCAVMSFCVKT